MNENMEIVIVLAAVLLLVQRQKRAQIAAQQQAAAQQYQGAYPGAYQNKFAQQYAQPVRNVNGDMWGSLLGAGWKQLVGTQSAGGQPTTSNGVPISADVGPNNSGFYDSGSYIMYDDNQGALDPLVGGEDFAMYA